MPGPKTDRSRARKEDHIRICAEEDVRHGGSTLLEGVHLLHEALPELDLGEIDAGATFFGKRLACPLLVSSMTGGGGPEAGRMNRELASAASAVGAAFAVGSQRPLLDAVAASPTADPSAILAEFSVRDAIPDGVLLGNIGAAQLREHPPSRIAGLARRIEADGLCVHLNAAQELVQPEGDRSFRGQLEAIERLAGEMGGRVLVKETGAGLSPRTLERLRSVGVERVEVAGSGGTSFTRVEAHRAPPGSDGRALGELLADWGVPTALSIAAARRILGEGACVVGSGGIESGLCAARAIALGADLVGVARPVLLAWRRGGADGARSFLERLAAELRAVMLLTGSRDLASLRRAPRFYESELARLLETLEGS
jgi:isopentenyl-diphosphate Delta-isomerase